MAEPSDPIKRSSFIPFKHNAETESFKRPNHYDFMTSSELKAAKFSGTRHNRLMACYEIWTLGDVRRVVTEDQVREDPLALTKAMDELFGLSRGT